MDEGVIRAAGVEAIAAGRGTAHGCALRIGRRAVLVPEPGAVTEGVAMLMWRDDAAALYEDPELVAYEPQPIFVVLEGGEPCDAICWNAPYEPAERDEEYARRLREAARRAGLSDAYIASLE